MPKGMVGEVINQVIRSRDANVTTTCELGDMGFDSMRILFRPLHRFARERVAPKQDTELTSFDQTM